MEKVIVAAVQMNSGPDKEKNIDTAKRLIKIACQRGAKLVILPELFNWRGKPEDERRFSETIPGKTTKIMAKISASLKIYLLAGSITETIKDNNKTYNSSVFLGPSGDIMAVYRKLHLFDAAMMGCPTVKEPESKERGKEVVAVDTPLGKIGLTICYDLRFPELYRRLIKEEVKIVGIPSAFTFDTGKVHWEVLVRARAIENQIYVIAPNQFGKNPMGYKDFGNSLIVDPWGKVLARQGQEQGEGVITAEIRLDYQDKLRRFFPVLKNIRRDIWGDD